MLHKDFTGLKRNLKKEVGGATGQKGIFVCFVFCSLKKQARKIRSKGLVWTGRSIILLHRSGTQCTVHGPYGMWASWAISVACHNSLLNKKGYEKENSKPHVPVNLHMHMQSSFLPEKKAEGLHPIRDSGEHLPSVSPQ